MNDDLEDLFHDHKTLGLDNLETHVLTEYRFNT